MQRELVERAQRGDHDAFAALAAAAISRSLDGAARLILHDPDQAKDAVQETLSYVRGATCGRCATRTASTPGSGASSFGPALTRPAANDGIRSPQR